MMTDDERIHALLEEILESQLTPEQVCVGHPELLREVRGRWERMQRVGYQIDELFPSSAQTRRDDGTVLRNPETELPNIEGYAVQSILGRGGMGVVFKALQLKLNRIVALKMLLAGAYAGQEELTRFRREAEAVAALRHPNIVQVHDAGEITGRPYFAMEYVESGSLAQRLAGKQQAARFSAELVATLACAVQFAHKSGFIHRDLKPANILLTADGTPKITDFGLARSIHAGPDFTLTGARMGTPSYMAPEQALGKTSAIGPAVDVYALGVILYEMLTGRPPFEGESAVETEQKVIAEEPVPPARLNRRVPRDLETICLKCLQKNPARRYASAQDLGDDLHRFLDGLPVLARPVGAVERATKWARRRPTLAILVLTMLIALTASVAASVWLQHQRSARQALARQMIESGVPRAYELGRAENWQDANQVLADLRIHLREADSDELGRKIEQAHADMEFARQLEQIRQRHSASIVETFARMMTAYHLLASDFAEAFAQAGFVLDEAESMAERIRTSEIRVQIVAALDLWALAELVEKRAPAQKRLLKIAQMADPDSAWRDRFRDPAIWRDKGKLVAFADEAAKESNSLAPHQLAITGLLLSGNGAKTESVRLLSEALRHRPGDFWLNWEMGCALHHIGKYTEAVTYFRIVLALRPENAWTLNRLGGSLSCAGKSDEAMAVARRAVELEPKSAILRHNLAVDYWHAKQFDKAEAECKTILESNPNHVNALFLLAHTIAQTRRPEEAIQAFRRVVEIDPTLHEAWYQLGVALANSGQKDEAARAFERAVVVAPAYFLGHYGLGQLCRLQGNHARAAVEFEWVIRTMDRDKNAVQALRNYSEADPEVLYSEAWQGLAEALYCSGQFGKACDALLRAIALPKTGETQRTFMTKRLERCRKLLVIESRLPAILAGMETPGDLAAQRELGEWLCQDRRHPQAAVRIYEAAFTRRPELADDLASRSRYFAACAASMAGSGVGEDATKLDEAAKSSLRKKALDWLCAERDAWAERYRNGTIDDQAKAARTMESWQQSKDLAGVRDPAGLAKLPEAEATAWRTFWADVRTLAPRDPLASLVQARLAVIKKDWSAACKKYTQLINDPKYKDTSAWFQYAAGEVWFEYAAVQLLAGDRQGYCETCKHMMEGAVGAPKMRTYLLARACTLAPGAVDDPALPAQVSARELENFGTAFWSLTQRGALQCRANRPGEAIAFLKRSLEADSKQGVAVLNWLWLALAYQQSGDTKEARRWLDRANSWLDSNGGAMPADAAVQGLHRHNWLEANILRQEAERVLTAAPAK